MSNLDTILDVAESFSSSVKIGRNTSGYYIIDIKSVDYKNNTYDIMARQIYGTGNSVEAACESYILKAKGKILFRSDLSSEKRIEFIIL